MHDPTVYWLSRRDETPSFSPFQISQGESRFNQDVLNFSGHRFLYVRLAEPRTSLSCYLPSSRLLASGSKDI